MAYQNATPYGSDYAKSTVDLVAGYVADVLLSKLEKVIAKPHPEQSVLVALQCLRKLAEEFPISVEIAFSRTQYEKAKSGFYEWYEKVEKKIPAKHRKGLKEAAEAEFLLWENEVLPRRSSK